MKGGPQAILYRSENVSDFVCENLTEVEVRDQYWPQFGISEARLLIETSYHRPAEGATQLMVVRTEFITHEAQNALLKIFEEPPESTRLSLIVPPDLMLLPTLLSRLYVIKSRNEPNAVEQFDQFLSQSYGDRLQLVESALKRKDASWQRAIKRGLISYLERSAPNAASLKSLEFVARLLLTRGASNKFLLEHLALTLPVRL